MGTLTWDNDAPPHSGGVILWDDPAPTARQKDLTTTNARVLRGAVDPIDSGAQMLYNALPKGLVSAVDSVNNWLADKTGLVAKIPTGGMNQFISEKEKEYQDARKATGQSGVDFARMGGNMLATLPVGWAAPAKAGLGARALYGAVTGAAGGALQPVADAGDDDFWGKKGGQVAAGAAVGGVLAPVAGAVARVIQPKASTNPQLKMLRDAGVNPTIGQALGGAANAVEEKMTSIPIMGDMISRARRNAVEQFNNAAINRTVQPIGESVEGIGSQAVRDAGDKLSRFYDDTLGRVSGVNLDNQFSQDLGQLQQMATGLVPDMQRRFQKTLGDVVMHRVSPSGGMSPQTYKTVDSELGNIAGRYSKSSVASEQELGDAVSQLQNLLSQNMRRSNPAVAQDLANADNGWANLVRIEGAAKAADKSEGVFTPGQLAQAVRNADQSTRKRAVARGSALMQDLATAGQNVLGNKVPNSFTTDRALLAGGGVGAYLINPYIPAALAGGGALYTQPVQRLAVSALADRPEFAGLLADGVRRTAPMLGMPLTPAAQGLLNR